MKRFATTLLMAMAAAGAWGDTVRMGALSTDTTVETLGEGAAAVQLVSKAKIDSMIETLSVGSDGTWLELNGSTGLIYQVVREVGYEGGMDVLVVSGTSGEGYNGPEAGTTLAIWNTTSRRVRIDGRYVTLLITATNGVDAVYAAANDGPYYVGLGTGVGWINSDTNSTRLTFPKTYTAVEDGLGSLAIDWYGIKTNVYQIALVDDIPDMGGYATTGAVAAVQAAMPDVAASTNWLTRAGLSGAVAFADDGGRPQAWTGTGALTVSEFSGLQPPNQIYWTLYGFDSVTLPASSYVVGGGAWQTNMVNHFTVWQVGTNVMLNFITATEGD